ncbi:VWA domain-containing protein [Bacteriovoracaceae bacterium]|nr:VWA domain-containing protein [Bacteriovoracaceae bacterium]
MFLNFFYALKSAQVPVTPGELLDLLNVLKKDQDNIADINPQTFYTLARSVLIKDESHYDAYDTVFAKTFSSYLKSDQEFSDKLLEWLKKAKKTELDDERKKNAARIPPEDLLNELKKRLEEQKKRHDGGNKWVGTGGTSPFGHSGYNPEGILIGGPGGSRSAVMKANAHLFREYRTDQSLSVRQLKVALKRLRLLKRSGKKKICIDRTIKKTCENAGDITPVLLPGRKNQLKLLLICDIGGSMTAFSNRLNTLFSACHQMLHFKSFKSYYFHNSIYSSLYTDSSFRHSVTLNSLVNNWDSDTRIIYVGDACMAPYELFQLSNPFYASNFFEAFSEKQKDLTSHQQLKRLYKHFPHSIWLNPEEKAAWSHPTIKAISSIFPMYFLGLEEITKGMKSLMA